MDIGIKIKQLRLALSLTQEELADRCELTKGYISQLENDLTSPSIATLADILSALGTNFADFFSKEAEEKLVFKSSDYFEKISSDNTVTWLVPNSQKNMLEPIMMTINSGCTSTEDMPHEGEEFGYILAGKLKLHIGAKTCLLEEGDSFYYTSDKKHFLENIGDATAKVLWVSTPPNF